MLQHIPKLQESVRALVETGVLVGTPGMYDVERLPEAFDVPLSVQAVLAERIDRLAPGDKHLLQSGSVVGRVLPLRLLQRVVELGEDALRDALSRLRDGDFIHEVEASSERAYMFKHALTQDVAYASRADAEVPS